MARRAVAVSLLAACGACSPDAGSVRWEVAFEVPSLAVATERLALEVRRDGCDAAGTVVYSARIAATDPAPAVPGLDPGLHAFAATAIDDTCQRIGHGCAELEVPADGAIVHTLVAALATPVPDCAPSECIGGACTEPDAGAILDASVRDGARPDGARPDGASCVPSCVGSTLVTCESGEPVTTICRAGCALDGELRCGTVRPSNVADPTLLDPGAADVTWDADLTIDTTLCAAPQEVVMLSPSGEACALRTGRFTLSEAATLTLVGSRPFVLLASERVIVRGMIDAGAHGEIAGAGGFNGGTGGQAGGMTTTLGATGGGGNCGSGGTGGMGTMGGAGNVPAVPRQLRGGSGGGSSTGTMRAGGGGGALQITSALSIVIYGRVTVGGGGGAGSRAAPSQSGGAGGGAGGTLVLEAPSVLITGTPHVDAFGGGGGGGGHDSSGSGPGSPGDNGYIGGSGGAPATGGGAGGAGGDNLNGRIGEAASATCCGGGGGGGAGFIHLVTDPLPSMGPDPGPRTDPCFQAWPLEIR